MIEIITYQEKYKADFIRLNTEWIETWFWLEESDRKTFATVDSYIIGNGGQIFLALDTDSEEVVGWRHPSISTGNLDSRRSRSRGNPMTDVTS